ncbi:MAG: hypothetical protein WBF43_14000 [Methylocella sp.]
MKHFIAFGHSHIVAVAEAYYERNPGPQGAKFVWLHDEALDPKVVEQDGKTILGPAIREKIETSGAEFVLMVAGGNEHNLIGLSDYPAAFDFVLPERPDLPVDESCQVMPAALLYATMARRLAGPLSLLSAMSRESEVPVIQIEPPPPIPDEEWIGHILAEKGESTAVRARPVRYKLWRLQSMLYRTVCAENGVVFLPCPAEAVDADGLLSREAWGNDATHANPWYGGLVLDQIERATT